MQNRGRGFQHCRGQRRTSRLPGAASRMWSLNRAFLDVGLAWGSGGRGYPLLSRINGNFCGGGLPGPILPPPVDSPSGRQFAQNLA